MRDSIISCLHFRPRLYNQTIFAASRWFNVGGRTIQEAKPNVSADFAASPARVPLFPLPDSVLFPGQVLPLHIFESRYREMVAEATAGDGQIAIALLRPGYEKSYFTHHAPIHTLVGVGKIIASHALPGGKFNILLHGLHRFRVTGECCGKAYRVAVGARVETYAPPPYHKSNCDADLEATLRETLEKTIEPMLRGPCEPIRELLEGDYPLGRIADALAGGLQAPGDVRQMLLEELDDLERTRLLINHLQTLTTVARRRCKAGTVSLN